MCVLSHFNGVQVFATLWTVAPHPSPAPGFSVHGILQDGYWSGLSYPPPRDLSNPGIEPTSPKAPTLQEECLPLSHLGSPTTRKCLSVYFSTSLSGSSLRKVPVISPFGASMICTQQTQHMLRRVPLFFKQITYERMNALWLLRIHKIATNT